MVVLAIPVSVFVAAVVVLATPVSTFVAVVATFETPVSALATVATAFSPTVAALLATLLVAYAAFPTLYAELANFPRPKVAPAIKASLPASSRIAPASVPSLNAPSVFTILPSASRYSPVIFNLSEPSTTTSEANVAAPVIAIDTGVDAPNVTTSSASAAAIALPATATSTPVLTTVEPNC